MSNLQIKSRWYLKAAIIHLAVMNEYSDASQSTQSLYQLLIDLEENIHSGGCAFVPVSSSR